MKQRTVYRWFVLFICLAVAIPGWSASAAAGNSFAANGSSAATSITINEDFTNYTYRYENNWTDWNIWDGQLTLDKMSAWPRQGAASVMQTDGTTFAGWEDQRGGEHNLFLQKLDRSGNRLWRHDQKINQATPASSRHALALVLDDQGGVFAVFKANPNTGSSYPDSQNLYAQHINANGQRLWQNDLVIAQGLNSGEPDFTVASVPGSGFAVLYKVGEYWAGNQNYYVQRFTTAGEAVFAQPVSVLGPADLTYTLAATLAAAPQGALLAAWISVDLNTSGANDLWGRWIEANGQPRTASPTLLVNHQSQPGVGSAEAVALSDGSAYLAYCAEQGNGWQGYTQRLDANSAFLWNAPVALEASPNRNICRNLDGVRDAQDNLILWWNHWDPNDPVRMQRISPAGQAALNPARVVDATLPYSADIVQEKRAAADASGDVLVMYALRTYIAVQGYAPDNTPRSPAPDIINDLDGTTDQVAPHAAASPDGNTSMIWQTWNMGRGGLLFQRFNASGQPLLNVMPRLDMGLSAQDRLGASLAMNGQNNAAAAWEFAVGERTEIHVQKISAAGTPLWPADEAVVAGSTANQFQPSIGADAAGNVYVAWAQDNNQVLMQKFSPDGSRQWNAGIPVNINTLPAGWQLDYRNHPAISVSPQGQVTVAWLENPQEPLSPGNWINHNRVYVQRFNASGQPLWSSDMRANAPDDNFGSPHDLSIGVDASGGVYALVNYMGPYDDETIVARITATGARPWVSDIKLSDPHHLTYYSSLAAESDGTALVAFLQPDVNPHIAARKISPDGTLLWDADKWVNDIPLRIPRYPSIATFPDGTATIAYELDTEGGKNEVFFSRLDSAGNRILGTTPATPSALLYQPEGEAQSLRLNPSGLSVQSAVLNADASNNGGSVKFYLSNDGGATWAAVTPGTPHAFASPGQDVRWRIVMQANSGWNASPVVRSLSVTLNPTGESNLNSYYFPSINR